MTSIIKVDTVQDQSGNNIINENANTITIGKSGDTVTLASGASQSGFGRSGSVDWVTTPKTSTFTGVSGNGYFINSGSALTCNLPAGTAGDIISFSDYARNFATYNFSISPNGSEKIGGNAQDATLSVDGQAATFVYVDSTKGWVNIQNAEDTETGTPPYIQATGGCITTCGNDTIHTFKAPGTFAVTRVACCAADNLISYMVVAGGGGGGTSGGAHSGGAGGAGGYRELKSPTTPYTASPLDGYSTPGNRITVIATPYPIQVGGGGAGAPNTSSQGTNGDNSVFSTITSNGGGGGGSPSGSPNYPGLAGGSGGGGASEGCGAGGAGDTPPTTPDQGFAGGTGRNAPPDLRTGGGGGATAVGDNGIPGCRSGNGGAGATTSISGSPTAYAGGGGGGRAGPTGQQAAGTGGTGGGGPGTSPAEAGGTNTGGGGGGGAYPGSPGLGAQGGSGVVIIRYRSQ